jgi:hypothetical protein
MLPKNYFAIDLVHTKEDEFKIIDVHGFSDAVSFTEKAGYKPRFSREYRFMDVVKAMRQGGEKILYLYNPTERLPFVFPEALNKFYESLPAGAAHLGWRDKQKRFYEKINERTFINELKYFAKAAKISDVDFVIGTLDAYLPEKNGIFFTHMDIKKMLEWKDLMPFEDIGLMLLWGHDYSIHPHANTFWYPERKDVDFPVLNSLPVSYALNTHMPKWMARTILEDHEAAFPREMYLGMGLSTAQELEGFRQELTREGVAAVQKPLCVHNGVAVSFLTQKDLTEIVEQEKSLRGKLPEIRETVAGAMNTGFEYTPKDKQNDAFKWYWVKGDKHIYPVAELGASILQEHLEAMPTRSIKTGQLHQGVIRAQLLAGVPIGVMHRFAKTPYQEGETVQLTDRNVKTFWERTDDALEERIVNFLNPLLLELEKRLESRTVAEITEVNDSQVLKRIQS